MTASTKYHAPPWIDDYNDSRTAFQLEEWVAGRSLHCDSLDQCCPDFSCCEPSLLAEKDERERFLAAWNEKDGKLTMQMCAIFLTKFLVHHNVENPLVLVADDDNLELLH